MIDVRQYRTVDFRYLLMSQVTGTDTEGYYDYDFECLHWDDMFTITYSIGDDEWYGMVVADEEVYLNKTQVAFCVTMIPLDDLPENLVV